jgi:gliding motility-associated-like protein
MNKLLLLILFINFTYAPVAKAQKKVTILNETQVKQLNAGISNTIDTYLTTLLNSLPANDRVLFLNQYSNTIANRKQVSFSNAYHKKNVLAYLTTEEIKLKNELKNLVAQFNLKNTSSTNTTNNALSAACGTCEANPGFELGSTNNWTAQSGIIGNYTGGLNYSNNTANTDPAQHTIVTGGIDEVGGFPRVCNLIAGNTSSLRLGNALQNAGAETISYQFTVSATKPFFTYYYAVVLEDAGGTHNALNQPRFTVGLKDGTSTPILCAEYEINGSNAASVGGFTNLPGGLLYKGWTPVVIPLLAFVGQCVTITFETRDCNFGDHFGYAYIDADCTTPTIKAPPVNCNNTKSIATLYAPVGAGSYTWTGPNIQGASNVDSVKVAGAGHWDCLMTTKSTNGSIPCTFTISADIQPTTFVPEAKFTFNTACQGEKINFNNTTTPPNVWTDYSWDIANDGVVDAVSFDISDVLIPNSTQQPKLVPVKLTTTSSICTADTIIYVTVNPKPVANAGANVQVCQGASTLLSSSTNALYNWYAGLNVFNNQIATAQSYTASPTVTSNYTLVVTNQYGCKDTDDVMVTVNLAPIASFTTNDVCFPNKTTFTNTTTNTGVGDVYDWIFETGSTSAAASPFYTYTTCGTKPVKLVVTSLNGCKSAVLNNVNVFCKPKAKIVTANVCVYDSCIINSTNIGATAITNYQWDFNYANATIQTGVTIANNSMLYDPSHLYTTDGIKNIALIVTNTDGCKDSLVKQVTIYPVPQSSFMVDKVCKGDSTTFTSTSTINAPDNIIRYQWDFNNDGIFEKTSTINTVKYMYPFLFKDDAYLITTSNHGCKDTINGAVEVYPLPATNYEAINNCEGLPVNFTNTSIIIYGNIVSSDWKYTAINAQNVPGTVATSFTFPLANYYSVLLTTTSNYGCKSSKLKIITVYPNPVPNFNALSVRECAPFCVNLNNTTTLDKSHVNTSLIGYKWEFGNGDSSALKVPIYCFESSKDFKNKLYDISLTAESDFGCKATITKANYIDVLPKPTAGFEANPFTSNLSTNLIEIKDNSIGTSVVTWNYGVNYYSLNSNAPKFHTISYNDSGTYVINQYVENTYGCVDTALQQVVINKDYNLYIPSAFSPNEDGLNEYFNAKYFGITKFNLLIFNRWGTLIARVNELNPLGWNGNDDFTNEKCKNDVYVWKLNYTTLKGGEGENNGRVTLIR